MKYYMDVVILRSTYATNETKTLLFMFIILSNVTGIQYSIQRMAGIWEIFGMVDLFLLNLTSVLNY